MNAPQTPNPEREKKKGGRPPKPEKERKTRLIKAYITDERYAKFKHLSKEIGHSISYIVSELCEEGKVVAAIPKELFKYFRDVSGMANNVNQMAKRLNSFGENALGNEFESMHQDLLSLLKTAEKYIKK